LSAAFDALPRVKPLTVAKCKGKNKNDKGKNKNDKGKNKNDKGKTKTTKVNRNGK